MGKISREEAYRIFERSRLDPVFFCEEILGVKTLTWDKHREVLRSFVTNDRVTVKSGHSMGKDFIAGQLVLWFLYCYPNSVVITTAPSDRQVEKILWGEISYYWKNAKRKLPGELKQKEIKINDKWYAIGFTTKETNDSVGKFQGFKSSNILVVATEAQAIEDVIYDQMNGILTSDNAKLYLAGNPLRTEGFFIRSFTDPAFKKFSFSCYESPNYIEGKEVVPGMASRKWVEGREKEWGKDSIMFQTRVLGEIPRKSSNSLISLQELEQAKDATPSSGYRVIGIDPARFGDDSTSITHVIGGKIEQRRSFQGLSTPEVEGRVISDIRAFKPHFVVIDEGAMGAGIFDHLRYEIDSINTEEGLRVDVMPFNFGGRSFSDKYENLGTQAYFEACKAITSGKVQLIEDDDLFNQLASRKYKFSKKGKMQLESKDDMKKRGLPSPDAGDSTVMALWQSLQEYHEPDPDAPPAGYELDESYEKYDRVTGYPLREVLIDG